MSPILALEVWDSINSIQAFRLRKQLKWKNTGGYKTSQPGGFMLSLWAYQLDSLYLFLSPQQDCLSDLFVHEQGMMPLNMQYLFLH